MKKLINSLKIVFCENQNIDIWKARETVWIQILVSKQNTMEYDFW